VFQSVKTLVQLSRHAQSRRRRDRPARREHEHTTPGAPGYSSKF